MVDGPQCDKTRCSTLLSARQAVKLLSKDTVFYRVDNFAQANNQWNIGAELGNDPMGSAFAHALTSGIKGVAMVLDEEVQPLTSDSTKCGTARGIDGNCMDSIAICAMYAFLISLCTFGESYLPKEQRLLCLGVWCLFEFFLSTRERLELVFVTNAGVVGDDAWRALVCLKVRGTRQPTLFV